MNFQILISLFYKMNIEMIKIIDFSNIFKKIVLLKYSCDNE